MRERTLVVGSDLTQLMDIAVGLRGSNHEPTLAVSVCTDALKRAMASKDARLLVVCLSGHEKAGEIAEFLCDEPAAVFIAPSAGLPAAVERTIGAFGQPLFDYGTPAIVLLAALVAAGRERALRDEGEPEPWPAFSSLDDSESD